MSQEGNNTDNGTANPSGAQGGQENGQQGAATNTPDGAGNNTAAGNTSGKETPAGTKTEEPREKTFTQEQVNKMIADRLPKAVKAELKKLTGESEGTLTVEELQRQLNEAKTKTQSYEARETVRDYLSDPANKLNIKADNIRAVEKLVMPDLTYDNDGNPSNLKEAVESARKLAPSLFTNNPASINAGAGGNNNGVGGFDMNAQIRRAAGRT
jgi:hypothetical protein